MKALRRCVALASGAFAAALAAARLEAQNLVPNPSFEQKTACPTTIGQTSRCVAWGPTSWSTTPDYMHACASGPVCDVPTNAWGTQPARTGQAYADCIVYANMSSYGREYLQAKLTSPLVAGRRYTVSFWVSLADKSKYAIADLGAWLRVGPAPSTIPLLATPQIHNPSTNVIEDKTGWTEIRGSFVAAGGEDHIVIGNFVSESATNARLQPNPFMHWSLYYIDDVSVTADPLPPPPLRPRLLAFADRPAPVSNGYLDLQDAAACPPAIVVCRSAAPVRAKAWFAGGTAYDPRNRTAWVSDGAILVEIRVGGPGKACAERCARMDAARLDPRVWVSGLAHSERRGRLFQLATKDGRLEVSAYDTAKGCPRHLRTCFAALPRGTFASGLAYDERSDRLWISLSRRGLGRAWRTTLWVVDPRTPCKPLCVVEPAGMPPRPILGLALGSWSRRLYATDGARRYVFAGVDSFRCRLTYEKTCPKQIAPVDRGLALMPGWRVRPVGSSCATAPCPTCPSLRVAIQGDPVPGSTVRLEIQGAPARGTAMMLVRAGRCGRGVSLPPPLCGVLYALPAVAFPPVPTSGGGRCDARAGFVLPLPFDPKLVGVDFCAQGWVGCPTSNGLGHSVTGALEIRIGG